MTKPTKQLEIYNMTTYFRVHPSINMARVGTSQDYYIAPETAAGELLDSNTGMFGGIPIKKGTENTPIDANDFRDDDKNPLRQAARFRLYAYDRPQTHYPSEDPGREIKVGDKIDGKTITDIIWTVHLANKKNNNYTITDTIDGVFGEYGIESYENGNLPPIRNPVYGDDLSDPTRRTNLVIDAGPRALSALTDGNQLLAFDGTTTASYVNGASIEPQPNYPISFPDDHFTMFNPLGEIDTLGEMTIEAGTNRLIVIGGYGKASGIIRDGKPPKLCDPIDNDYWFDDTSDGPVCATVVFDNGDSTSEAVQGWVICTDPGYAPQTRNVVSTWDDIYNTWIEDLSLSPAIYSDGQFLDSYDAAFNQDVLPIFHSAMLQQWNTNLPQQAINGHKLMASIQPSDNPSEKLPSLKQLIRDPNIPAEDGEGVKMPLALGDAQKSFLSVTPTQYQMLSQWYDGKYIAEGIPLGIGEKLDRVTMENCLGGRYSPGIDLTFIVRDVNFYMQKWKGETGPFRLNMQNLDYTKVKKDVPFLQVGYVPLRLEKVEPGDVCKFMSQPWHTDYNSCGTHTPDPNPDGNNTLYWSWPAQRPFTVYPASQCTYNSESKTWNLGGQLFSIRGDEVDGVNETETPYPQQQGRYQCYYDYVTNWHKVGFIIQGTQIATDQGDNYGADKFLEVASLFNSDGNLVEPWPQATQPGYKAPSECGPDGADPCTDE